MCVNCFRARCKSVTIECTPDPVKNLLVHRNTARKRVSWYPRLRMVGVTDCGSSVKRAFRGLSQRCHHRDRNGTERAREEKKRIISLLLMAPADDDDGDYVAESQESDSSAPSHDGEEEGRVNLFSRDYTCHEDVVSAVVDYNHTHGRAFKVVSSDYRRYKAVCVDPMCTFVIAFSYGNGFGPPSRFAPHSCDATQVDLAAFSASRGMKASYLARVAEVRQFVIDNGREASPADLHRLLCAAGRSVTYQSCVFACRQLKAELFQKDSEQYQYIHSYVHELNKAGHMADLEVHSDKILRVVVVYKQGIQVVREFADRGINLDGTFMKHNTGGALLVACLKNSNNEIQIVAVAWVSGETKDNWSWFVSYLLRSCKQPAFVISDRDKGLIPAMQVEAVDIPHFVCLRHMLENFNAKFHSQALKDQAWKLAKSLTVKSFERRAAEMKSKNAKALEWLTDVDLSKWATAYSPCPRFGTMTSNNVESVNNVLLQARAEPLLDCLMTVERYVGAKWIESVKKGLSWGHLTAYAQRKFEKQHLGSIASKIEILPSCGSSFLAKVTKTGELSAEYVIDLDDRETSCSCGYFAYMKAPCKHVIAALKSVNKLSQVRDYYDPSWTTEAYKRAYDPAVKIGPFVIKDALCRNECHQPPPVPKKRGRPKKTKRIESQPATEALKMRRKNKCNACGGLGHNKRTCKG